MLKWAVNCTRQTYLQSADSNNISITPKSSSAQQLKRKSSELRLPLTSSYLDKEDQYTSTPLPTSNSYSWESPLRKPDSLRDLSNIVPAQPLNSPVRLSMAKKSPKKLQTPESTQTRKNLPNNYASTLPTFDVEYSPCALIPGPILALRGVGIPDSYFEKPRYITGQIQEEDVKAELFLETKTFQKPKYGPCKEESTLSSSKMGDVTLEHMIDAILESNRKDKRFQKPFKNSQQLNSNMSPTYTPAEDPASDLHEVWDSEKAHYRQKDIKFRSKLTKKSLFKEREVCRTPTQESLTPIQLMRQRGLRRKRKITQLTKSVKSSAKHLWGKQNLSTLPHPLRNVFEPEMLNNSKDQPNKPVPNFSPDSGHNSSSEYVDNEDEDSTLELKADKNQIVDNSKRRLTFSLQNLAQIAATTLPVNTKTTKMTIP